jgi:hypothetical protein
MSLTGFYSFSFVIILSAFCLIGCGSEPPPGPKPENKPVPKPPVKVSLPEVGSGGKKIN